jgi:hypothetical protein
MVPSCVQKAICILKADEAATLSRESLVAFSFLEAFKHHYPSRVTDEMLRLSKSFSWIRQKEDSRFIRQRRIALAKILEELN